MSVFLSIFCEGYYWSVDLSHDRIGGPRWKITESIIVRICIRFRYHDDVANCHIAFTWTNTWMSIIESTFQFAFPLRRGTWMHHGPTSSARNQSPRDYSQHRFSRLFSRFVESPLGFGSNKIDRSRYHFAIELVLKLLSIFITFGSGWGSILLEEYFGNFNYVVILVYIFSMSYKI